MLGGGGVLGLLSVRPHFCLGGGGGSKSSAPLFPGPQGEPAHGLHPRFVVAEIWADRVRGGGEGGDQKWPTFGQSGYVTRAVSRIPTALERGVRGRGGIRSGPLVGTVATSPLPSWRSPALQSGGQNQKWPTSGQSGYINPYILGIPTASEPGEKSEVAHKRAESLRHPCRLGDPHRFKAGGKIRSGPQVGKVATSPLLSRGSPPLQSGGQNQNWSNFRQSGYVTHALSGIPTA